MKLIGFLLVISGFGSAQTYTPIEPKLFSENLARTAFSLRPNDASARPTDMIFPYFAVGGPTGTGWETSIVIVNMSTQTVSFDQFYYDTFGNSLPVTFRTIPDNQLITTAAAHGVLQPGSSFNIVLFDTGQPLQTGWSQLVYDSASVRLGGYSIFRLLSQGSARSTDFEALVPLSAFDDYKFFMPFDNRQGFITSMAVLNPGNASTGVTFTIRSGSGAMLGAHTKTLPPGQESVFRLQDDLPETAGTTGVIYVEGSTGRLSALGFRFNAGFAFATVPIMNWSGMFP